MVKSASASATGTTSQELSGHVTDCVVWCWAVLMTSSQDVEAAELSKTLAEVRAVLAGGYDHHTHVDPACSR
eukprot:748139-Hanusia_phi.AAC.1